MVRRFFLEKTNEAHGGTGWDLGEWLWSPVGSPWNKMMKKPKRGDYVIHSVDHKGAQHFRGYSIVEDSFFIETEEPPLKNPWSGKNEYYKIPVKCYSVFPYSKIQDFLNSNQIELERLVPQKSFYSEKDNIFRTAQGKYLAEMSYELFTLVCSYLKLTMDDFQSLESLKSEYHMEIITKDLTGSPRRVSTTQQRIIRDTSIVKDLKKQYMYRCQICGKQFTLPSGSYYCEGHHLQPLGSSHQGPDIKENIILVCPNHHLEFDYGVIGYDPVKELITHIDPNNEFNQKSLFYHRVDIHNSFFKYHMKNIYNQ